MTSWSALLHALKARFAPSTYEDPTGLLFKLTQRASVNEYLSEFESLTNRIIGLPTPFLLSRFVSRLSPEIRREVQALQLLSLIQAASLARLQEEKFLDTRRPDRYKPPPITTGSLGPQPPPPISPTPLLPNPPNTLLLPFYSNAFPLTSLLCGRKKDYVSIVIKNSHVTISVLLDCSC